MTSRNLLAVIALTVVASTPERVLRAAGDSPTLTVRVTPLVRVTRGDARGVVTVPRHRDNRVLRVTLESEDYYSLSEVQLDGEEAPLTHVFYWRDLPRGSYCVSALVYGVAGLRTSISIGDAHALSQDR